MTKFLNITDIPNNEVDFRYLINLLEDYSWDEEEIIAFSEHGQNTLCWDNDNEMYQQYSNFGGGQRDFYKNNKTISYQEFIVENTEVTLFDKVWSIYLFIKDSQKSFTKEPYLVQCVKLQKMLLLLQEELQESHDKFVLEDNDSRSGWETYGYESYEGIISNFEYISDRFQCRFRLRWLLDFPDLDLTKLENKE